MARICTSASAHFLHYAICNPKPLLPDINVHAKFEESRSETTQVRVRKRDADGRTDTQMVRRGGV